jgi:hypothetical protein
MTSRETRYLCLIGRDGFNDVPKLLIFAKSFKLTLGRVITTSSDIDYEQLSASNGDCFIELIGLCLQNPKQLLVDLNRSSRNINAVVARADSISVRPQLCPQTTIMNNTELSFLIFRRSFSRPKALAWTRTRTALYVSSNHM